VNPTHVRSDDCSMRWPKGSWVLSLIPFGVKDNVRTIAAEIVGESQRARHPIRNVSGYASWPDHNNRRCVDFMVVDQADGDWVSSYLVRNSTRLGVEFLIWNRRVWRSYRHGLIPPGKWVHYSLTRNPHTDHNHVQFTEKPYVRPTTGYLGPFVVDPAKVTTFLYQMRSDWTHGEHRLPGYVIRTGVATLEHGGRLWVRTEAGHYYAMEYLRRL